MPEDFLVSYLIKKEVFDKKYKQAAQKELVPLYLKILLGYPYGKEDLCKHISYVAMVKNENVYSIQYFKKAAERYIYRLNRYYENEDNETVFPVNINNEYKNFLSCLALHWGIIWESQIDDFEKEVQPLYFEKAFENDYGLLNVLTHLKGLKRFEPLQTQEIVKCIENSYRGFQE